MFTTADNFHPMRGHVADGCSVLFANGEILTLKSTMLGWQFVNWENVPVSPADMSACDVDRFVYERNCP